MRMFVAAICGFILMGSALYAQQQQTSAEPGAKSADASKTLDDFTQLVKSGSLPGPNGTTSLSETRGANLTLPDLCMVSFDKKTDEAREATLRAYYGYLASGYDHRKRVFAWQYNSSIIIFAVVVGLVVVGIFFSWLQFRGTHHHVSTRPAQPTAEMPEAEADAESVTQIEASLQGIKVSSPVLGVIILVISFMFFYLYLVCVYPIENIF